jgi:class 3 adenylate cyclase/tetratricopeptide (TPR) repeat protein
MALRTGTWTIVFTDVVGSTAQRARIGDVAANALRREHDRLIIDATVQRGGEVVKGTGDGSMLAFAGAGDAVAAAVAVQQRVERRNRTAAEPLHLRIGIAIGDVYHEDADLFGMAVVEAERICAIGGAGDVLLSSMVRTIAGERAEVSLVPIGPRVLKGLPEPVDIWRAQWSTIDDERLAFPALLAPDAQLAFAGRAAELDRVIETWKEVLGGSRRAMFISGEPGIGKTRLAAEAARVAYEQGAVVLYGRCDEGLNTPHQPFVEALDYYFARADHLEAGAFPGELSRVSSRVRMRIPNAPEPTPADPESQQHNLFEAISSWLAGVARHSPVVLVVDDMHWASRPTVLMLRHILRTFSDEPLLVLATFRDTDLRDEHPLQWALADLRRLAGVELVPLVGLDEEGVIDLLERISEQEADAGLRALAHQLHADTEGNPLFIGEVLRHLVESGLLVERDGRWTTTVTGREFGTPDGILQMIGQRLQWLGPHATAVLQVASCIGRDFPLGVLIATGGSDENVVVEVVERALEARLIEEVERDHYRFTHALVRNALLERLSSARRTRIHRRIAEDLELRQPSNVNALAYQWCEASTAGDVRRAVMYSRLAASSAQEQAAFDEAVALLERACDVASKAALDDAIMSELWLEVGDARMNSGRVEGARDAYVEAAAGLRDGAPALVHIALNFHGPPRAGSKDDRHAVLVRRALRAVDEHRDPALAARLHAQLSLMHDAWTPTELREAERAVELAHESGDQGALCDAYRARFWTAEPGRSWEYAEASLAAARNGVSTEVLLNTFVIALIGAGQRGDYERFEALAREHAALAEESQLPIARGFGRCIDARMHATRGELTAAESLANEAIEITIDPTVMLSWGVMQLHVLRMREQHEKGVAMLRSWFEAGLLPESAQLFCEAALALFLAEAGRVDEACARFDDLAIDEFARVSDYRSWMHTAELAVLSDLCVALGDQARAEHLIRLLRPWEAEHLQISMAEDCGPATLHLGRLESVVGHRDDAIAHLRHAVAETSDGGAWWKACESKLELGRVLLRQGLDDDAMAVLDEAGTFARAAGLHLIARKVDRATVGRAT